MDVEPERKKLLVTDRDTFEIITTLLANPHEKAKKSIEWLEQAKQSIIYYMQWLYVENANECVSFKVMVPYFLMESPLKGTKLPINGHPMKDNDETLSLAETIQLLRLMEATDYDQRDFSSNSVERLNYRLYLFARKMDEENADGINEPTPDGADRIISEIGRLYNATAVVFNITDSEKIHSGKNLLVLRKGAGDETNPVIFMIRFLQRINILCYDKKSNKAYYFNKTINFQSIMPRLKKTINNYNGGTNQTEPDLKLVAYPTNIPLINEKYISFYILFELCKASARGRNTKQSIRLIAPWLDNLDNETMILFKRYLIRTYLFPYSFLPLSPEKDKSSKSSTITTQPPLILYDTSGEEEGGDDQDDDNNMVVTPTQPPKKNNNNNNNSDDGPVQIPDTVVGGDDSDGDVVEDINIIPDTEDDTKNERFSSMSNPLETSIVQLAILSDEGVTIPQKLRLAKECFDKVITLFLIFIFMVIFVMFLLLFVNVR
mgnify:CR=1 FL=1